MGFNFSIFQTGGGSSSGQGITKYPTAGDLPLVASDGDVGIVLDTNVLYSYDSGSGTWVVIGGPGVTITASDTASINMNLSTNNLTADLNIGSTTLPANTQGISLLVQPTGSTGLYGYFPAGPISEVTSTVLQFSGPGKAVGFSFGIQVNQASGSTPGYLSAADWAIFNAKVGISAILQTEFPILGGTNIPSSGGITLSIPAATGTTGGYLTGADWLVFSKKLSGLTGPIQASNVAGSSEAVVAVFQAGGITLANFTAIDPSSFLGNAAGTTQGVTTLTVAVVKSMLGISGNNFGDVTLGAFLAAQSTVGATISAAQVLSFTEAQTTNPGMVSPNDQSWNGIKYFNSVAIGWSGFGIPKPGGPETVYLNSPAGLAATTNYFWPPTVGVTLSNMRNNGAGVMTWSQAERGDYITVTNAGATLVLQNRFIEITTGVTAQTLNIGWGTGNTNVVFNVQKIDSGLGSVTIQSDRLINGVTNFVFSTQWESHKLVDNGIGLRVIT